MEQQTPPAQPEEQQPGDQFRRDIDFAFSQASHAAAHMVTDAQFRKTVHLKIFYDFYQPFYWLYIQTSPLKAMSEEKELSAKIQNWFDASMRTTQGQPIPVHYAMAGVGLFREYASAMDARGIHCLNR